MQFKYPELLWAFFLLLIPIFIHLFQLRRFKKTPFTNVKLLKKVVSESRRSNVLKKWLLLCTRLLLLSALVLAFAQPFFAEKAALKDQETVIYLDDSFSMQAKADGTTLLDNAVQELIRSIPQGNTFTLFTNEKVFKDVDIGDIQNDLLALTPAPGQLKIDEIRLKASTFFTADSASAKHLILISDFQKRIRANGTEAPSTGQLHTVKLSPDSDNNVSLDSLYLIDKTSENLELAALVSSNGLTENIPVSLYNGEKLIAKTSAVFNPDKKARVNFTLPKNELINGKLEISDTGLTYDNQFYFNIGEKEKIKVLAVGDSDTDFLKRIYGPNEFQFTSSPTNALNYGDLADQNLIVLNELEQIPTAMGPNLKSFTDNGGILVVIPAIDSDADSYNALLANYFATSLIQKVDAERSITHIAFSHPLFQNVFEKEVVNFQYPKVSGYYRLRTNAPVLLSYQDNDPFLVGADKAYIFTAAISSGNSNFKNAPLIVPTMYNMGINSLKTPRLYSLLGNTLALDVATTLPKDRILKVSKGEYEFIPRQQSFANKVGMVFNGDLVEDGIYQITDGTDTLKNISFNHSRGESELAYMDLAQLNATSREPSIASLFQTLEKDSSITELWKWFVILALLFLLVEILIQKFVP